MTALVTPALDYVGGLELGGVDVRFASEGAVQGVGEALRSFLGAQDDGVSLLFLSRVEVSADPDVRAYEAATSGADSEALRSYVAGRASWLRSQPARRSRVFLFFSRAAQPGALERGHLGTPLLFKKPSRWTEEKHVAALEALGGLRDRLSSRLAQLGIGSRELEPQEVFQLHDALLNPGGPRRAAAPFLRDNLFASGAPEHLREYTEAEQLCRTDLVDRHGHLESGKVLRRVLTLKVLPEGGTDYFLGRALQQLAHREAEATVPFPYTLAVAVTVENQALTKFRLNMQHRLVEGLRGAIPFLSQQTIGKEVEDQAKQSNIAYLFTELNEMATKVVSLSASVLLEAPTLEALEERTTATEEAFSAAGNSSLYREEVSQLPAFLSLLPGSGPYQLRKKGCTSRNAADFLPLALPWTGGEAHSVLQTPSGENFRFALFDKSFGVNAHHGLVAADTGSGKSFAVGMFVLDALAAGLDAILVDNGNSWRGLTELVGGTHLPVDLNTSISPFLAYEHLVGADGQLDTEAIRQAVRFIEVCVTDQKLQSFDLLQQDIVGRAITCCYQQRFRGRPTERPLLGDFRDLLVLLAEDTTAHQRDRETASELVLRLRMFCDEGGTYSKMLNRPSKLRFDARLLTFEMEKVSKDPLTKKIALAAIMEAVSNRAAARRRKTLVAVDEAHEYLGADPAAETFLAGCYAKMRKYDVAMWTISQKFETFVGSRVAPTIIGNSALKLFLWHSSGHSVIGDYFQLPRRAVAAFAGLERRPGRFSDAFLIYGTRMATLRLAPHPLAYWVLTTDGDDQRLLARAAEKNPQLGRLQLLEELAARYPHGAVAGARKERAA